MTPLATLLAYLAAAAVVVVTPGMDTALVLRTSAIDGPKRGVEAAVGVMLGCLAWGASVALGLGALLLASHAAYAVVRWAGAAYLAWLGLTLVFRPREALAPAAGEASSAGRWGALKRGLACNLLNPKVGVFYVSFLPMFVPAGWPVTATLFGLSLIHAVLGFAWLALLSAATVPLGGVLARRGVVKWLDRATGSVFLLFSARLALSER